MNLNTMRRVENVPTENTNILDSNPDVEVGPIVKRKRRRTVERDIQEDEMDEIVQSGEIHIPEWTNRSLYLDGSYTTLCCPSYRLIHNLRGRHRYGDLYCTNYVATTKTFKLPALGGLRVRKLLEMKTAMGDLTHTRDHLHWSLLTARPGFWDSLMRLINQEYPGMYTPNDKPLISSYKFTMPRNPDESQLKKMFPCLPAYFGPFDGTQNYWLTRCPWCRNIDKNTERQFTSHVPGTIRWLQQTAIPELHARDVAMKWAYLGRRLVFEI